MLRQLYCRKSTKYGFTKSLFSSIWRTFLGQVYMDLVAVIIMLLCTFGIEFSGFAYKICSEERDIKLLHNPKLYSCFRSEL